MPTRKAYNELKRIFGADHVSEAYQSLSVGGREQWCYVAEFVPDAELIRKLPRRGKDGFLTRSQQAELLEAWLTNQFSGPVAMRDRNAAPGLDSVVDDTPLRFIIPQHAINKPECLKVLQRMSGEALRNCLLMREPERHREEHRALLMAATHGMPWSFVSGRIGEGYQSVEPVKNPDALQLALLSKLGLSDEAYFTPSTTDGHARIAARALLDGNRAGLMESILAETLCTPSGKSSGAWR